MPIPIREKNPKLTATTTGAPAIVPALRKLGARTNVEVRARSGGSQIPASGKVLKTKHLQGVTTCGDRLVLSTSVKGGNLFTARRVDDALYVVQDPAVPLATNGHPGGIQAIGHYVAVPTYPNRGTDYEVQFRDVNNALRVVRSLRMSRKPYCVGVTTTHDNTGEYYVLAAVTHPRGDIVEVYRTPPNLVLGDPLCMFWLHGIYNRRVDASDWIGYPNSISLLSDTRGKVFFVGLAQSAISVRRRRHFRSTRPRSAPSLRDLVDVYHLDMNAPGDRLLVKLDRLRLRCARGASLRWGASASVTGADTIAVHTCERDVQSARRQDRPQFSQRIRLNAFL